MKIFFFSSRNYEIDYLKIANKERFNLSFNPELLDLTSVEKLSDKKAEAISVFTNDDVSEPVLQKLASYNIKYIAVRAAGYNNVDLKKAKELSISVANVPEYSPYSVAEHTVGMILSLNRKYQQSRARIIKDNFTLDGLEGFDIHGKTVGIIGMGRIGKVVAKIMKGFGCKIMAYDILPNEDYARENAIAYASLEELYKNADIITLHAPLNEHTNHLINKESLKQMKPGVMIINSGRGALINTQDIIEGLKSGKPGALGMDVYEYEKGVFFYDHSEKGINDPLLKELLALNNVMITPHMGFLTSTALRNIAETTFENLNYWAKGKQCKNELG